MGGIVVLTAAEQVAAHLRAGLRRGAWSGLMPGGDRLAAELGVGRDTVESALRQLEREGLLVNQGRRRGRRISMPKDKAGKKGMRIGVLLDDRANLRLDYMAKIEHGIEMAGHQAAYAPKTMADLGMDTKRIVAMVKKCEVDAWLVLAGTREVLEWFAAREAKAFALFGRRQGLPMAGVGPDKRPAIRAAVRALAGMGHKRIVLLTRRRQRLPEPGVAERVFLEELMANGITPGNYHLPDWDESAGGLQTLLDALYQLTPPTALIIDEAPFFVAAQYFLGRRGLRVPEDVSLVCNDSDPAFEWCQPPISHIRWDSGPVVRRVLKWANHISHGVEDRRQTLTPAEFETGGTIGPARG